MTMVSKLFNSRKFLIICIFINSVFIIVLSGFLLFFPSKTSSNSVTATSLTHQSPGNGAAYDAEKEFTNLFSGSTYTSGDKTFDFKMDKTFAGYFNDKNPSVTNATYDITYDSDRHSGVILITYKDFSILYDIDIDDDGNLYLILDSDNDVKYQLS